MHGNFRHVIPVLHCASDYQSRLSEDDETIKLFGQWNAKLKVLRKLCSGQCESEHHDCYAVDTSATAAAAHWHPSSVVLLYMSVGVRCMSQTAAAQEKWWQLAENHHSRSQFDDGWTVQRQFASYCVILVASYRWFSHLWDAHILWQGCKAIVAQSHTVQNTGWKYVQPFSMVGSSL